MHTYTRSNSDTKISHFNYFFKFNYMEEISQHPNTAGEEIFKRLSHGVAWSRSVYITIMLQKWGPRWNLRERMCERMVRIGLGSVEERSLSRLGEPSCCSSEQRRRREPMPATAAQCFGERETRQRASTPFHNLVPQHLPGHKEREGEVVDFNVLVETETLAPHALRRRRRTAFSCCRGNRLQRSVPEWRFSSSVLNRRPPQAELQPRVAEERRRSVRTESFRQRQARTCTAANQSLVAAERGRLLT